MVFYNYNIFNFETNAGFDVQLLMEVMSGESSAAEVNRFAEVNRSAELLIMGNDYVKSHVPCG